MLRKTAEGNDYVIFVSNNNKRKWSTWWLKKSKKNYKQVANCLYEATEYKVNRDETSSVDFQGCIYKEIMVGISHDNTTPR